MAELLKSDWLSDWYMLTEYQSAQPEGSAEEWRAIIEALRSKSSQSFRRVAVWFENERAYFCSPRNSVSDYEACLDASEIDEFVRDAEVLLDEHQQVVKDGAGI